MVANKPITAEPPASEEPPAPKGSPVEEPQGHSPFPIVGIGASAGGLEAMSQLLSSLPINTGMAFMLVQHLDPRHESKLPELLARSTRMPVLEAAHGLAVRPNTVYVIPPNTRMALSRGNLALSPREEQRGPHLPVDYLFRSLAVDQQSRAIAAVLSGTGSDGTQGLCEVKAVGGITFAQDQKTAAHSGMPQSATDSGCVDFVLPPDQIAKRLAEIGGHPYLAPTPPEDTVGSDEENYKKILAAVRAATGVDFNGYRDTTIKRRIMRRMAVHTHQKLTEYAERLRSDRAEVETLSRDLLINVTSFFREPEMFEALKAAVFPNVVENKPPGDPIRIWVPGCSTGQEAYSLAMALVEFSDKQPVRHPFQIFATDLDEMGLEKARTGHYPEGIEGEVSPERLRRFFRREDHVYRIDKAIRDVCVFARHNVTADPPFSHLDLISCRNVLIYLTTPLQKRVVSAFHYALNSPGFLALGGAETVGELADLFDLKDRAHRIYTKKQTAARQHPMFLSTSGYKGGPAFLSRHASPPGAATHDYQKEADRILLGRYAPPGVLVDENFGVLQFRGRTSPYLEAPPGEPTTSILKLAREGLFLELRNGLSEAKKQGNTVRRQGIRLRVDHTVREIALEIVPVQPQGNGGQCYLVLFLEPPVAPAAHVEKPPESVQSEAEAAKELMQLRQELAATREYLQSMIEQQDAANEELRSANEEVLSSNEELQSTNEELETAKEELQSSNEELSTVNEQLQRRNLELDTANNDLVNLLSSANIPVVMVGSDLRIRRLTPPARTVMSVLATDVGRPIGDIKPAILVPDLEARIAEVIERVQPVQREVRDRDGHWYMLRIHPYRTADNKIDGAVLVMIDIDQIRRDAEQLRRQLTLLELSQDAIIIRDAANRILFWNSGAEEMYGWPMEEARGKPLNQLIQSDPATWAEMNRRLEQTGNWDGELHQTRRDGTPLVVHVREVLLRDEYGRRAAVLAIKRDVTESANLLKQLRDSDRRKDEFLATLAHELRNPLAPLSNGLQILRHSSAPPAEKERALATMDRQLLHLTRLIEDLLDVSRVSRGLIDLRKERVNLAPLVQDAVDVCRPLFEKNSVQLAVGLPHEPLWVEADPIRLAQVVENLLTNAAKYTSSGGRVSLVMKREGGEAALRVKDNGIGMKAEALPHIWDLFAQEKRSPSSPQGLGIGLTLVRRIVELHGGTAEAFSEGPDKGSEFVIRLPLMSAPSEPEASATEARNGSAEELTGRQILVVDDDTDVGESLADLLRLMKNDVCVANDGKNAVQVAASQKPEIILLDLRMPGMDGYDVVRRLRQEAALEKTVIIALSGYGAAADRQRCLDAGFDGHLVKPIDIAALKALLAPKRRN